MAKTDKSKLDSARRAWEEKTLTPALSRHPESREEFKTVSEVPINRLYTPLNLQNFDYLTDAGFPGEYPYTRGVQPTMYRGRLWTMRQYAGFATAEESNKRYKYLLEHGGSGLSVAFDLPTQMGYDSDHPLAEGEVGKVGVAIDSLKDMEILFDGIPLDQVSTSMTINAPASILLAMYMAVGEQQGVPPSKLRGTIQNDILKEYIARGTYIFPPQPSLRIITDIFQYCAQELPRWNTISISGYHIREAGSTAVQEVAFTLANAITYVQAAVDKGLKVDDFAPRLAFFFNAHIDLFEELAKFRAARRLWARIMKERFAAQDPNSMKLRFHTQTAGCSLTAQQTENNVVRVTLEALASVLGGTQSLHTNSMDEALALPSETAVRVALRTQQILAHESGVGNTNDPCAGSYFVESLTNKIEAEALEYIKKIDGMGGMQTAIEKGYPQHEIHESAYDYQQSVETGSRAVVGVNTYQMTEKPTIELLRVDPRVEQRQLDKLKQLKQERDNNKVQQCLAELRRVAGTGENLMPVILDSVKHYTTLGELCDVLREVFGVYEPGTFF
ncbi:acyl-CoA mutase large subunit family protein [[Eubacterium] cellulosolvens]